MVITETELKGAFVIELKPFEDVRGFFARAWSDQEFEAAGLNAHFVESNISFNKKKGTLRGMHLPVAALRADKAGALHAWQHLRRDH